ncbi:MAG: exodeoxyribonuclease VII small subunit [Clostridiales bacterium]|nr:exodeoxyribonuclease VII small subunit [Clostridiales bacterium]
MDKNNMLEEKMSELSDIIKQMENPDVTLSDSFELYKKGVLCINECTGMIDNIEKELIILEEGRD